ncbi:MAG: hypothetical protein IJK84_06225 [Bacteroidales bacterium]|nr:hypothetical protein [Bacteroidales bacterium]
MRLMMRLALVAIVIVLIAMVTVSQNQSYYQEIADTLCKRAVLTHTTGCLQLVW